MEESADQAHRREKKKQRNEARRQRTREWKRHVFWRRFAMACLLVFTLLALLVILSGVLLDHGPLARSQARQRDAAQAEELRLRASTQRTRLVSESIQAASVLGSTLAPAALEAGAAGQDLLRTGDDLTAQFLKDVGFPLGRDATKAVASAIWRRYVKSPEQPAPALVPGASGRATSTINLSIVIREGRRPQVITKVIRVRDSPD